ncbi:MAG TPA: 3-oxoacyl-ACP reductase FabG [Firmicutes bacterium]|nr:3-oxoacyl-ACP reductase FabG [Bacillota bacterium]
MFDLSGKNALVTGASGAIGSAIAFALAEAGADIACHFNSNRDSAEKLADSIRKLGRKACVVQANLTKSGECDTLVDNVVDELGEIHILVNNAGVNRESLLFRESPDEITGVLEANLASMIYMSKAVGRRMAKERWGRLIHIGSVIAHSGFSGVSVYAASKAGIEGMSRALARELGHRNVTSNVLAPGFIDVGMTESMSEGLQTRLMQYIALGRKGTAREIAAAAVYLASEEAGYVTGAVLHVNGGLQML